MRAEQGVFLQLRVPPERRALSEFLRHGSLARCKDKLKRSIWSTTVIEDNYYI